jgi:hypothetical protein
MPLQNRVNPFSNIIAVSERGTCMGNRGILHDEQRRLKYYHKHKAWIICRLEFKGRYRQPMTPNRYTELFFLDEATALAAGHRPCAECSRPRYNEFVRLWKQANPGQNEPIDIILHRERFRSYQVDWRQKKQTYIAPLDSLPFGAFITLEAGLDATPYLVVDDSLRPWTFAGYDEPIPRPAGQLVTVLTPPSIVRTMAQGYRPRIYPEPYGVSK